VYFDLGVVVHIFCDEESCQCRDFQCARLEETRLSPFLKKKHLVLDTIYNTNFHLLGFFVSILKFFGNLRLKKNIK
jgi:hypothetical protein